MKPKVGAPTLPLEYRHFLKDLTASIIAHADVASPSVIDKLGKAKNVIHAAGAQIESINESDIVLLPPPLIEKVNNKKEEKEQTAELHFQNTRPPNVRVDSIKRSSSTTYPSTSKNTPKLSYSPGFVNSSSSPVSNRIRPSMNGGKGGVHTTFVSDI